MAGTHMRFLFGGVLPAILLLGAGASAFAQCATRMMKLIDEKKKEPEQVQGNVQLSLFQFGMETGRCR